MTIEIVFDESFETVRDAVTAAFADVGFRVAPTPLAPGVELQAKMAILRGERGSTFAAMLLPFLFKVESLTAIVSAYDDGTVGVSARETGAYGGNVANGAVTALGGGASVAGAVASAAGSLAAQGVDHVAKKRGLEMRLAQVEAKLRERLGARIAYEGPVKAGVNQVPA